MPDNPNVLFVQRILKNNENDKEIREN